MDLKRLSTPNRTNFIPMYIHRRYIGLLGFLLPLACIVFGWKGSGEMHIQPSISAYYYTRAHFIFIAVLVLVAGFMLTYRGYNLWDRIVTDITGVFAVLATIFPTAKPETLNVEIDSIRLFPIPNDYVTSILHLVFAALLFAFFAAQCFFLFTKTNTRWKRIVYYICGGVILVMLIVLAILFFPDVSPNIHKTHIVFILEAIMLAAFGSAWAIKGKIFERLNL